MAVLIFTADAMEQQPLPLMVTPRKISEGGASRQRADVTGAFAVPLIADQPKSAIGMSRQDPLHRYELMKLNVVFHARHSRNSMCANVYPRNSFCR